MLLAFPSGNLQSRLERLLVAGMYFSALVVHPVQVLFQDTTRLGAARERAAHRGQPRPVESRSAASRYWFALVLLIAPWP